VSDVGIEAFPADQRTAALAQVRRKLSIAASCPGSGSF